MSFQVIHGLPHSCGWYTPHGITWGRQILTYKAGGGLWSVVTRVTGYLQWPPFVPPALGYNPRHWWTGWCNVITSCRPWRVLTVFISVACSTTYFFHFSILLFFCNLFSFHLSCWFFFSKLTFFGRRWFAFIYYLGFIFKILLLFCFQWLYWSDVLYIDIAPITVVC